MNIVSGSLRRPMTVVVLVIAACLAGFLGIQKMSRDIFPPLGIPTIYVAQPYGGMDPAQMEGYLAYYYEYHFLYITGIEHVESRNIQGASLMKLQFHPGTDMAAAMAETVQYVNRARAFMPPGTVPPFVMRFDAGSVAVGQLVFSTENPARTVGQMQDAALNMVRPLFATLPGVSAPPPFGGSARTIVVNVKPDRMRALGLSPDQIVQAIAQADVISPSGNMNLGDQYPIVPVNAVAKNIKDLEGVPLRVTPAGAVYVRDVATVDDQADIVTSYALVNGRRTVYMPVTKRADPSTLTVVDLGKKTLPKFQQAVPDHGTVTFECDQTPVVLRAIDDLVKEGAIGAVLTGLMVLLFLRDWRSALVVVLNIPISLLASCFALWVSGQSIHLMTLGGLALSVGVLVDEATVAIENIHAHLARGVPLARAARDATSETTGPRFLAMLCILAVFTPALFMTGAARALFAPLALAVGFAMIASYFLSSTLVPILSIWLLRKGQARRVLPERSRGMYEGLVRVTTAMRWVLVPVYLAVAGLVLWGIGTHLGVEIFPRADAGQMALRVKAPTGTKVENTEQLALRVLDVIKREAGQDRVSITMGLVGVHASNYPVNYIHLWNGGPEEAWLAVQFKKGARVDIQALQEKLRGVFPKEFPSARVSFEPGDIVARVMSFGSSTPIEVAVSGPDLAVSREYAEKVYAKLKELPELRDVQFAQALDYPSVNVDVNRERAGLLGVKMNDVTARAGGGHDFQPVHAAALLERSEDRRELQPANPDPPGADENAGGRSQRAGRRRRQARAPPQRRQRFAGNGGRRVRALQYVARGEPHGESLPGGSWLGRAQDREGARGSGRAAAQDQCGFARADHSVARIARWLSQRPLRGGGRRVPPPQREFPIVPPGARRRFHGPRRPGWGGAAALGHGHHFEHSIRDRDVHGSRRGGGECDPARDRRRTRSFRRPARSRGGDFWRREPPPPDL